MRAAISHAGVRGGSAVALPRSPPCRACLATHPTTMGVWTITLVANGGAVAAMLIEAPVPAHPMQVAGQRSRMRMLGVCRRTRWQGSRSATIQ